MRSLLLFTLFMLLLMPSSVQAEQMHACFTPGEDCTGEIVAEIDKAGESIWVQAYGFTSAPIAFSLVAAKQRGVNVQVILDKSQRKQRCNCEGEGCANLLAFSGIPILVDTVSGIAHNKVMIMDGHTVITGSFNFTKAAQYRNAENIVVIWNEPMAEKYAQNWQKRALRSVPFEPKPCLEAKQ